MKYKGVVCEKCGVEVTAFSSSFVRRMGHIDLAAPCRTHLVLEVVAEHVFHRPALDMTLKELERVLYFEAVTLLRNLA